MRTASALRVLLTSSGRHSTRALAWAAERGAITGSEHDRVRLSKARPVNQLKIPLTHERACAATWIQAQVFLVRVRFSALIPQGKRSACGWTSISLVILG